MTVYAILAPEDVEFPPGELALKEPNGLLCVGGNLRPETILKAYKSGIFPWNCSDEPIIWWHPDPRMILYPDKFKASRSLRRVIASGCFEVTVDQAFDKVVAHCASVPRSGNNGGGTWLRRDLVQSYVELHRMGFAHSIESWHDGDLSGGLFGVSIGRFFSGESMFHLLPNASKVALAELCRRLSEADYLMIDCQIASRHLASLGACEVPRGEFMQLLKRALASAADAKAWDRARRTPGSSGETPRTVAAC